MSQNEKPLLTYREVAQLLGKSVSFVHELHYRHPDFPVVKLAAHTHIIPRDLLMDWLAIHAGDGSLHNKKVAAAAKQSANETAT
ncbi:MAG: hypothetical protein OWU33_15165 [Firmicutes bacterium]|jgi:hypothetical protein|nr:hypothetical protein [Bacillota bacterium]